MSKVDLKIIRIIDANFNRAKEGLRVCEDVCRYALDLKNETKLLKHIRHDLSQAIEPLGIQQLMASRETQSDVGRFSTESEMKRKGLDDVFYANAQRVKESLRVLEEIIKLISPVNSQKVKALRYRFYDVEKKMALRS